MKVPKIPVLGDRVTYCMIRNINTMVKAIVTETSVENPKLGNMQIRIYVPGIENQHPTTFINFSGSAPAMGHWFWNEQTP